MNILVTGGAGFIGRYVCEELEGMTPIIYDIADDGRDNVKNLDRLRFVIRYAKIDAIIHLAGILGNPETIADPVPCVETNILGSINVFEAAGDLPVVYATVGNKWLRSKGTGSYTITKTCVEDFVAMYNQCRGSCISIVRPVNAYGPGQKVPAPWGSGTAKKIMPTFIHQALNGGPIEVYGTGAHISDMVWVGDVAKSLVAAIGSRRVWGCGPTESNTVYEVAQMVRDEVALVTGKPPVAIACQPMPTCEVPGTTNVTEPQFCFDTPMVDLKAGIAMTVASYRYRAGIGVGPRCGF